MRHSVRLHTRVAPALLALGVLALGSIGPAQLRGQERADSLPAGAVPGRAPTEAPPRPAPRAGWTWDVSARADLGYATNVFQTDSATGDAFTRLGAAVFADRRSSGGRLTGRAELTRKFYREFSQADELEGFFDLTAAKELGALTAGLSLRSAYLDLRLLDREGNLLPRTTFASFSQRALGFFDLRLARTLYVAAEGGYRLKEYEETEGLTSLDYDEWSAKLGITRYLPWRLSLRLQGTWEDRAYRERRAADASGFLSERNPELQLRRLEGELRLRKRWGREGLAEAAVGLRGSEDRFEDELSYTQQSATVRLRHPSGEWLLGLRAGVTLRDFELRRSGAGEPLEEDYLTLETGIERKLGQGVRVLGGYELFRRSTNDVLGGYTLGNFQLGLVYVFF